MLHAALKSSGHPSPGAASASHVTSPGPGRCPAPGSPDTAPQLTALATVQGSSSAPTVCPADVVLNLGLTWSSAKLPLRALSRAPVELPRGSSKLLTAFNFFLNTCSFMETHPARSKHIQTHLLYDTRGCQRNGEKPLLIHSAVPAQPWRRERPPGTRQHPSCRSWEWV